MSLVPVVTQTIDSGQWILRLVSLSLAASVQCPGWWRMAGVWSIDIKHGLAACWVIHLGPVLTKLKWCPQKARLSVSKIKSVRFRLERHSAAPWRGLGAGREASGPGAGYLDVYPGLSLLSSLDPGLLVINTVWHKLVTNTWTTNKQESNNICELWVSQSGLCEVLKVLGFRFRVTNGEYAALYSVSE